MRIKVFNSVAKGGVLMLMATGFAFINVRLELESAPEGHGQATEAPKK